jgi:hypothetical protein
MRKVLLNLVLTLLLFSVVNPVAYQAGTVIAKGQIAQSTRFTVRDQNYSIVKHLHQAAEFSFHTHVQAKPCWSNTDARIDGTQYSLLCHTLLQQNLKAIPHQQQLYLKLLYPFHFFS